VTTYYDATNGQVTSIDDHGRVTSFAYDSMGRRISTTLPDTSVSHTSYWPTGQEKASWGSQTNPTVKLYSPEGQLTELRTFRSTNLALAPDETTGSYDKTTWAYNDRNQLERKEYADTKGTDYTYTDAGRLKTRRWQRGNWTRYDYDSAGSLEATRYFTPATTEAAMLAATTGNDPLTPDVIIQNDKLGRQETVTQHNQSVIDYTYDPATLVLDTETISYDLDQDGTADFTRVLDRKPTSLGRDTGWQLKNGATIENEASYTYHATTGRLETIGRGDTPVPSEFTYGYLANSNLIETITATAGAVHTVTNVWEPTRNVLDLKQNKVGTNIISSYDYTVNAIGQRTNVSQDGTAFQAIRAIGWGYDSLGQVTSADSSENTHDRAYEYDAIGNRLFSEISNTQISNPPAANTTAYTPNALNQYTAVGSLNPVHDDDGNMTSGPLPIAPGNLSSLEWDAENRLVSATVGTSTTTYLYDAQSRRIAKTTGGITTLFIYDGWNCIAEWSADLQSASLTKTYLWGTRLVRFPARSRRGRRLACSSHPRSTIRDLLSNYDGNGNVSEYLAANGSVTAHFEYDPFGNTVVNTDTGNLFPYRFSTKPQDGNRTLLLRLPLLRSRSLAAGHPGIRLGKRGVNLYGFVGNDAVWNWDKLGLEWLEKEITGQSVLMMECGFIMGTPRLRLRLQPEVIGLTNLFPS
jgi:YD repeat-containing protein